VELSCECYFYHNQLFHGRQCTQSCEIDRNYYASVYCIQDILVQVQVCIKSGNLRNSGGSGGRNDILGSGMGERRSQGFARCSDLAVYQSLKH
jgi:hypothetical protein